MASKLSKLGWYWHRLRAMDPNEIALRFQKKAYQFQDAKYSKTFSGALEPNGIFPALPKRRDAPVELLNGLRASVDEILRGEWRAFGHLPLKVDDPPKWQFDYLVGRDFQTGRSAFKLDHRAQPGGADIKIIWEPSRWNQLVRLAMGAWILEDAQAREKCIEWLHNWVKHNEAFTGLNWTSGLETGIRLIQFTWIDALLSAAGAPQKTLHELRRQILPPHVWYTWRYRSFGSSANNHLIGELVGIILALARWTELSAISSTLTNVAAIWEKEVLAQFEPDGGNKEQALGYHLFSFEFCWQAQAALESTGLKVSEQVKERLRKAGEFYGSIKPEGDPWELGDCDNAWVTPLFANEQEFAGEWWHWFRTSKESPALRFWWGEFTGAKQHTTGWKIFDSSGMAVYQSEDWLIRFDFSPLGYPSIAPHGHLDALHLSVWHRGQAIIVDPGTGAYYADKAARDYLAGWSSHNSPHLKAPPEPFPRRIGTFLWSEHHVVPRLEKLSEHSLRAEISLPYGTATRTVTIAPAVSCIRISDTFSRTGNDVVATRWKFAPSLRIAQTGPGNFTLHGASKPIRIEGSHGWKMTRSYNPPEEQRGRVAVTSTALGNVPLDSIVSPAFRAFACAPYLTLESSEAGPFEMTISAG